jgi:hypothetical protein
MPQLPQAPCDAGDACGGGTGVDAVVSRFSVIAVSHVPTDLPSVLTPSSE